MTKLSNQIGFEVDEKLIFERSQENISGIDFFDEPQNHINLAEILGKNYNPKKSLLLPNLCEAEAVRHYTRLSRKNVAIDIVSYPLGSCTMKYNPKLHEWAARLSGLSTLHPYWNSKDLQAAYKICFELQNFLSEIGGFYATSLAPAAGAQGEFSGIAMIQKALLTRGEKRTSILVPKSAHGTNPATAGFFSYKVIALDMDHEGKIILEQVQKFMNNACAGIMITNPNTLGIYETQIKNIAEIVHSRGGYVYGDGANLNALMGIVKPGQVGIDVMHYNLHKTMTTPHGGGGPGCGAIGASQELAPFLPIPYVKKNRQNYELISNSHQSIGRIRTFLGNFAMIIRAWVYIKSLGAKNLKEVSKRAILNANYIRKSLQNYYHIPYNQNCLHEVVLTDKYQQEFNISTLDIAKRLIDFGIHPPTIYFPLVVAGALMIEPTETESKYDLDNLIEAFIAISHEARENPEIVKKAPHSTKLGRLNEAYAARNPVLTYQKLIKF